MHSLPNWRVLVPFLVALVAGLVVAWSSSAASDPATTANATRGSIAVVGNGLYRRFPSGRLALLTEDGRAPAWSHDGRRIAFVRPIDTPGSSRVCPLFVMNSDGSNVRPVGQANTDCSGVSWGPGDRQIVFGGAPRRITPSEWASGSSTPTEASFAACGPVGAQRKASTRPGLLTGAGSSSAGRGRSPHPWGRLAAVRPDGSGYRVLVGPRAGQHDDELTFPAWSRDGRRLAYVRIEHRLGRAGRTIEVADARGQHRRVLLRLPYNPSQQGGPTWSPNGRLLAYWGVCGQGICVSTVPSRGGRPRVLLGSYANPRGGLQGLSGAPRVRQRVLGLTAEVAGAREC